MSSEAAPEKRQTQVNFWLVGFYSFIYIFHVINSRNYANVMFILILAWGICAMASGGAQNFLGMMCVWFAIGLAKAGFYPSMLYYYVFCSILSGLLAYAISFINQVGGISRWRWLFILKGLPAILLSFIVLFRVPNYLEMAKMLTPKEREYLLNRLIGHGIGGFGVNYALPTVIYKLGFTTTANSQLINIPPYVACFLFLNTVGYCLQKNIIIICYIILITVTNPIVKYHALIVATACAGSAYPVIWPERIRALEGTVASGIGIRLINAMAQFSGIAGPHVYNTRFGPTYRVSYIIYLCFLCFTISGVLVSWILIKRKDQKVMKESEALDARCVHIRASIAPSLDSIPDSH
ncbi:major facilitator superfamily domain-containing protein [Aspergillus stella-maris]|uniref:major facilitator superfamily domain-containing protein n=1 Tax=Aspergillus stella-maris TaxID=1810926 RepID=UPI003CCE27CD